MSTARRPLHSSPAPFVAVMLALVCMMLTTVPVTAAPFTEIYGNYSFFTPTGSTVAPLGPFNNGPNSYQWNEIEGNGSGPGAVLINAKSDFGTLGASALATVDGGADNQVEAEGDAQFGDNLSVVSSILPVGTPVTIQVNTILDGGLLAVRGNYDGVPGIAYADISLDIFMTNSSNVTTPYIAYNHDTTPLDTQISNPTIDIGAKVGDNINMFAHLQASSYVRFNTGEINFSEGYSNYYNTAHVYADSLTPGVTLTSASGYDYAMPAATTAVPEPSPLTLFGLGVCGLFGLTLRGKIRRRQAA